MRIRRHALTLLSLALTLLVSGCAAEPEITTTTVPRVNSMERTFGAIVFPKGENSDKVWFFKLAGSEQALTQRKDAFDQFIHSVRFDDKIEPTWPYPKGWTLAEKKAADPKAEVKMERFATLRVPAADGKALDLTVLPLPMGETIKVTLLINVNRWRKQLGLHEVGFGEVGYFLEEKQLGAAAAYIVDIVGPGAKEEAKPMLRNPHQQPIQAPPPPGRSRFKYETPPGWKEVKGAQFSQLAFKIGDPPREAQFTLTAAGGDFGSNFQRWAGQVNLNVDADKLTRDARTIKIAGKDAKYVDLIGPDMNQPKGNRILGAILMEEGQSWFFKFMGPAELVGQHKRAFEAFLDKFAFE